MEEILCITLLSIVIIAILYNWLSLFSKEKQTDESQTDIDSSVNQNQETTNPITWNTKNINRIKKKIGLTMETLTAPGTPSGACIFRINEVYVQFATKKRKSELLWEAAANEHLTNFKLTEDNIKKLETLGLNSSAYNYQTRIKATKETIDKLPTTIITIFKDIYKVPYGDEFTIEIL